jgi:alpha-tubulin suppressor-like RCC1 family protein
VRGVHTSGEVYAAGYNYWGQLGTGDTTTSMSMPVRVMVGYDVAQVAADLYHTLFRTLRCGRGVQTLPPRMFFWAVDACAVCT